MIPTQTELRHFIEVYSTQHFTRAAMKLGIAQPSLTQSIHSLEEKTKTNLFHRTRQGCIPTKAAELFYTKVIQLQDAWSGISEELTETKNRLSGTFRVGCHQSVGIYTLPGFFKNLSKSAPDIEIRLHHDWSRNITEKIVGFELDLGFVINPVKHRDLILKKIGEDRVLFWKKAGSKPPSRIFADTNLMQVKSLLNKSSAKKFLNWQVVETSSLELIRTLVSSGAGIGILPERVAKASEFNLEIVSADLPQFHDDIYLAYRMDTLKSVSGKALIEASQKCL